MKNVEEKLLNNIIWKGWEITIFLRNDQMEDLWLELQFKQSLNDCLSFISILKF